MDLELLRSLSPVLVFFAFAGICWWAFSPSRKEKFNEAANLPFVDDEQDKQPIKEKQETQSRDK